MTHEGKSTDSGDDGPARAGSLRARGLAQNDDDDDGAAASTATSTSPATAGAEDDDDHAAALPRTGDPAWSRH